MSDFLQAKSLLGKVKAVGGGILLSGGLSRIRGAEKLACEILETECAVGPYGQYLSAIGCALQCQ